MFVKESSNLIFPVLQTKEYRSPQTHGQWSEKHNPTAFSQADKTNTIAMKDEIVGNCPHIIYLCEDMCMHVLMSPNSMKTWVAGPRKPSRPRV